MVQTFTGIAFTIYLCISKLAGENIKQHAIITLPKTMEGSRLFVKSQSVNGVAVASAAVLRSSAGLAELISTASNLRAERNSHQHVLSFGTDHLTNNIVKDVLETGHNITFLQFKRETCLMRPSTESHSTNNCPECKNGHIDALLSILGYLRCKKIAIITSTEPLNVAFSNIFLDGLKKKKPTNEREMVINRYELGSDDPVSVHAMSLILSDLSHFEASSVIVFANDAAVDMLFKMAGKYKILYLDTIWLLVGGNQKKIMTEIPKKVLNMQMKEDRIFDWSEEEISTIINEISMKTYDDISDGEQVQSAIKCQHETEIHFNSIIQERDGEGREWTLLSKWKQTSGLEVSPTEERWLQLLSKPKTKALLRVVCLNDKPFTSILKHCETEEAEEPCDQGLACKIAKVRGKTTTWKDACCIGHSIDILHLLANDLNFVPQIHIVEDGFYGSKVNGTWNGVIGELAKDKADLAATQLTMTKARSTVVDFTAPYSRIRQGILMLNRVERQNIDLQVLSFLDSNLLWVFLAVFISGFFFIFFNEYMSMKYQGKLQGSTDDPKPLWMETFTYMSGITFQRDLGGRNPKGVAARLSAIVVAFGMVVAMTAYTAILTATKVVKEQKEPFRGIHDERLTNPNLDFKFATVNSTSMETFFKESQNPSIQRMHKFMKRYNVKDTEEGVKKVLDGELQGLINEWDILQYYVNKQHDCSLHISDLQIAEMMHSFAVQKGSKWKDMISRKFIRYIADDVILRINKKWLGGSCHDSRAKRGINGRYRIGNFIGLFLGTLGTIATLVVISIILLICHKFRANKLQHELNAQDRSGISMASL